MDQLIGIEMQMADVVDLCRILNRMIQIKWQFYIQASKGFLKLSHLNQCMLDYIVV